MDSQCGSPGDNAFAIQVCFIELVLAIKASTGIRAPLIAEVLVSLIKNSSSNGDYNTEKILTSLESVYSVYLPELRNSNSLIGKG